MSIPWFSPLLSIPGGNDKPYPGNIKPGEYSLLGLVDLLREHKNNPDAIQFIADMLEE